MRMLANAGSASVRAVLDEAHTSAVYRHAAVVAAAQDFSLIGNDGVV